MDYPCLMYRSPGPHKMPGRDGPTYGYIGVNNATEEMAACEKGYSRRRNIAIGREIPDEPLAWEPPLPTPQEAADNAVDAAVDFRDAIQRVKGPGRDELEADARELGIGFNAKTSDTVLAERIAAKLEGQP